MEYRLNRLLTSLFLVLAALITIQCGSSSDSSANSNSNSKDEIDIGNLKPKPLTRTKWVYEITSYGETTRVATEVSDLNASSWTVQNIVDGIPEIPSTYLYKVIDGKTYYEKIYDSSGVFNYTDPGQRIQVDASEMPFHENYSQSYFGAGGFGSSTQRRTFNSLGTDTITVPAGTYTLTRLSRLSEYLNSENNYASFDFREIWQNDEIGVVQEIITDDDLVTIKKLKEFSTSSDIQVGEDQVTSASSGLVLTIPEGVPENTADAIFKELYTLANNRPECRDKGTVDLVLGQTSHLYHRYYLFQENLPSSYSDISNTSDLVELIAASDPYTFYFDRETFATFSSQVSGSKSIIGIQLGLNHQSITDSTTRVSDTLPLSILGVTKLSRAWYDGLEKGDEVLKIDGKDVNGLTFSEALDLFPSNEGDSVTIIIRRDSTQLEINTAAETHISSIMDGDIAYLNIRKFTAQTGFEIQSDYEKLVEELGTTPSGVILDLRSNSGGSTAGTQVLLDYLINKDDHKQHLMFRIKNNEEKFYFGDYSTSNINGLSKTNFVVLINENSASASEVTSGVLKHYDEATLIGDTSFGKGVSQSLFELIDKSGVAITYQELLLPDDIAYHGKGIQPDIVYTTSPTDLSEDLQLQAAIEFINTGSVTGAETASSKASQQRKKSTRDPWVPGEIKIFH